MGKTNVQLEKTSNYWTFQHAMSVCSCWALEAMESPHLELGLGQVCCLGLAQTTQTLAARVISHRISESAP